MPARRPTATPVAPAPTDTAAPADPAQVLRQFRVVFAEVRHHFQQIEKQVGIGGAQVWTLSIVGQRPGLGMAELAAAMDVHQSTASNLVRQLLKRGLMRSDRSTLDRRAVEMHLTPEGQALLAQVPGPHEGVLPRALRRLPAPALAQLQSGMTALMAALKADEQAGGIPLAEL
jgi:DNA-binding MarR family transcriptional regulator